MKVTEDPVHAWFHELARVWRRPADASDFVWLGRFRLLTLYVIFKSGVLLLVGIVGLRIENTFSPALSTLLLWVIIILGVGAIVLLLILGMRLASKRIPRSVGMVVLCVSDVFVLVAVGYACIIGNVFLLLLVLAVISCSTPLFVERISRYATSYRQSKDELLTTQQKLDALLKQYSQELKSAVQTERASLSRELHDKLMQELSVVLLQSSILLMRDSSDGNLQLSADEAEQLDAGLRKVAMEARRLMQELKTTTRPLQARRNTQNLKMPLT